jgi:hypothetical protein
MKRIINWLSTAVGKSKGSDYFVAGSFLRLAGVIWLLKHVLNGTVTFVYLLFQCFVVLKITHMVVLELNVFFSLTFIESLLEKITANDKSTLYRVTVFRALGEIVVHLEEMKKKSKL